MRPDQSLLPPSPPPVDPNAPPPNPLVTIPLTPEELKRWRGDLTRSETKLNVYAKAWDRNLAKYAPEPSDEKWGEDVNPGVDFYQVEQKKAQLFFDTPEIILEALPGQPQAPVQPGQPPPAPPSLVAQQARLNQRLSLDGLNVGAMIDEVMFDLLCPAGMAFTKIGWTNITQDVPMQDPTTGQPAIDPLTGQPKTMPVPIFQETFWEHFSAKKGRIPANFRSTQFDKAPWLGERFTLPLRVARQMYQLPDDFEPKGGIDQDVFRSKDVPQDEDDEPQVSGVELWYKASLYDDREKHPQIIRQLVLIDGLDDPVVHRDSPYQPRDASGKLLPSAMIGFPIHVFTIRNLSDSAYVPSDCTITRPTVNEIGRFLTQMIDHRDASTSVRLADESIITPEVLAKIIRSPYGAILPVPPFDPNHPPITEISKPVMSRENFTALEHYNLTLSKITALSPNQTGAQTKEAHSATESQLVAQSANVRMKRERNKFVGCFLGGVRKLDALLQQFPEMGQPPTPSLGRYAYAIKPDSGIHVDAAEDRKFAMDAYNFLAKDPNVNRSVLLQELLPLMRLDPSKLITQPPPPTPEPPKFSFIIKGDDLNPMMPQYANMLQALAIADVKLTMTPVTPDMQFNAMLQNPQKQPEHQGSADTADKVNQHQADESGQMQGQGGFAGAAR